MVGGRPRRHHHQRTRMAEGTRNDELVYSGVNQNWSTDLQVAINDGKRRRDAFFTRRVKSGTSWPFQQPIPMKFAKVHPELHKEKVTLESPSGVGFRVVVLRHNDGMRFGKGWRQFSVENHLRGGYYLLFTLVQKLHFTVTFYDHQEKSHTCFPPLDPPPVVVKALNSRSLSAIAATTTTSRYRGVGNTSGRGNFGGAVESLNGECMSRAMRLLQQQGCRKFSEIVSKCQRRRYMSNKDRSRAVKAAMRFASAVQNAKFLAVMCDAQVYHGFHLPIPREILEETETLQAKEVKVCLTDTEQAFYVANWAWQPFCETPLLNSDGWAKFALDHTLEEGDVCVFELTDLNDLPAYDPAFVFCVHIFRAVEADCGGHTPLHITLEEKFAAAESEIMYRKRPITDRGLSSQPRKARRANNPQPLWTKLIKPWMQGRSKVATDKGKSKTS